MPVAWQQALRVVLQQLSGQTVHPLLLSCQAAAGALLGDWVCLCQSPHPRMSALQQQPLLMDLSPG